MKNDFQTISAKAHLSWLGLLLLLGPMTLAIAQDELLTVDDVVAQEPIAQGQNALQREDQKLDSDPAEPAQVIQQTTEAAVPAAQDISTITSDANDTEWRELDTKVLASRIAAGSMLYETLDSNVDGLLDSLEVGASRRSILKLDSDSDGNLSPSELGADGFYPAVLRLDPIMQVLDTDGDYNISTLEVVDVEAKLKQMDLNGDWQIDQQELKVDFDSVALQKSEDLMGRFSAPEAGVSVQVATAEVYLLQQMDSELGLVLGNGTELVDSMGQRLHYWAQTSPAQTVAAADLLPNGLLLRAAIPTPRKPFETDRRQHGLIELLDWNGNVIWNYQRCDVPNYCLYGQLTVMPNGNVIVASTETGPSSAVNSSLGVPTSDAMIYELRPNYKDSTTEIVWQWGGGLADKDMPSADSVLSYNHELDQLLMTSADQRKVNILDHSISGANAVMHRVGINDLVANTLDNSGYKILDAQWVQDIAGQADIALLVEFEGHYSIYEIKLVMNKNGTYTKEVLPQVVKVLALPVSEGSQVDYYSMRPISDGGFLLVDGLRNRVIRIDQSGTLFYLGNHYDRLISGVQRYQPDYAAFSDKSLNLKTSLSGNESTIAMLESQETPAGTDQALTGIWSMMIETPMGTEALELKLVQQGDLIAGDLDGEPVSVAVVDNTIELTLERVSPAGVVTIVYQGVYDTTGMSGEYTFASGPTTGTVRSWSASR